jgi:hypothetical protein
MHKYLKGLYFGRWLYFRRPLYLLYTVLTIFTKRTGLQISCVYAIKPQDRKRPTVLQIKNTRPGPNASAQVELCVLVLFQVSPK